MAGNWILGGRLLNNQTIVDIALQLDDGCWNTYASTVCVPTFLTSTSQIRLISSLTYSTGIGPEAFAYFSSDGNYTGSTPSADQLAFYNEHGFFITTDYYYMRPEVLESNFYAWRYTGDVKYYYRAVSAYQSLEKYLKTPNINAFAPINNVNELNSGFIDDMESFWFAEVLKYLYLTFDDPNRISLDNCKYTLLTIQLNIQERTAWLMNVFSRFQHRGAPLQGTRSQVVLRQWQTRRVLVAALPNQLRPAPARQCGGENPCAAARRMITKLCLNVPSFTCGSLSFIRDRNHD